MTALAEAVVERTMARAIPLSVHVDLTMTCNERCVHCYRVIEDRRELSTDELKALFADLARAGTQERELEDDVAPEKTGAAGDQDGVERVAQPFGGHAVGVAG